MLETYLVCLALNVYHEGRGELLEGQMAIAWVVYNRAKGKEENYCKVVYSHKQFSWTSVANLKVDKTSEEWATAVKVARTFKTYTNPIGNATHYHAISVAPRWVSEFEQVAHIGDHVFYAKPNK